MSFKDCINGKITEGQLDKKRGEAILEKFDKVVEKYKAQGTPDVAARAAAERLLNLEQSKMRQNERNLMQHVLKQKEINSKLNSGRGTIEKKVSNELHLTADRVETVKNWAMSLMHEVAEKFAVNYAGLSRDHSVFEKGLRVLLGEAGHEGEAVKLGNVLKTVFDALHERYKQAGGIIGKLENYFPQVHAKEALLKSTPEAWKSYITPLLDITKIIDEDTGIAISHDKLSKALDGIYESVTTSGRSDMAKLSEKGEMPIGRKGDLDKQLDQSRFLHFKDADSFLEYNRKFGVGDNGLVGVFANHVNSMSRKIAIMEKLGPRPNAMMRFMDFKMGAEGKSPFKKNLANAEYRVLASQFQHGDTDAAWWRMLTGTQNWLRGAMLGGGVLSALPDTTMLAATAKINGLDPVRALGNYLKIILPGSKETKTLAARSGYISHALSGGAIGDTRFAGESMGKGLPKIFANAMNELSGLQRCTRAAMDGFALEASATLAEHIHEKVPWNDVEVDLKSNLEKYGINEKDWTDLHKAQLMDHGDAKFLVTSDLRTDSGFEKPRAKELADKIDDWINGGRRASATEPTLTTQAMTTGAILGPGAGGQATVGRAVGSTLGLFKSFPITSIMTHLLPAMKRAAVDRKFDHLAMVTVGTTLMGAVANQLKDLTKGKTPADMDNYKFWVKSILQGGGLGLYGDFLFGDYSRFGRSPLTEMGGPVVGLIDDLMAATKGNLDKEIDGKDTNIGRDLFRVAKRNIPLGSLWYARLALDRLLLDNLERLADPQYDRRMGKYERTMRKQTGQEFWWRPGESSPR